MEQTRKAYDETNAALSGGPRPAALSGVRVLDFSHQAAGPWATTLLGDLGADVVKVEKPGRGDAIRHGRGPDGFEVGSLNFWGLNRSKRSLTVDLGAAEGVALVRRILPRFDVLLENFRPGVMERKGLGYGDLAADHPRLVYCSISAFGPTGPMAQKPGMDLILQATGGVMGITGEGPGRPPVKAGPPIVDIATGIYAAYAVAAALFERERSGRGQKVEVAMLDAVVSLLADVGLKAHVDGVDLPPFGSGHPDIAPYQAFRARDGYFVVACLTSAFWKRLPVAIGHPELLEDPRFRSMAGRVEHRSELERLLNGIFEAADVDHWIARIEAADIPTCRVNSLREAFSLPQLRENGALVHVPHPRRGSIEILGSPVKMAGSPGTVERGAPGLGEHTDEILAELGIERGERAELRARGVV